MLASQAGLTQKLIAGVVEVNRPRKDFIADQIIARHPKVVRIYRLVMKEGSPILPVLDPWHHKADQGKGGWMSLMMKPHFTRTNSPDRGRCASIKVEANLIASNRLSRDLEDVADEVFPLDLFGVDQGRSAAADLCARQRDPPPADV